MRMGQGKQSKQAITVVIDTGPLYALFDGRDHWHERVRTWCYEHPKANFITTWVVLAEVCHLLSRRIHNQAALDFLTWVRSGAVTVDTPVLNQSLDHMLASCLRYADLPLDLADASVAEVASRHNIKNILSVDADFTVYRDSAGKRLNNLLV